MLLWSSGLLGVMLSPDIWSLRSSLSVRQSVCKLGKNILFGSFVFVWEALVAALFEREIHLSLFLTADTVGTKPCAAFCGLWTIIACLKKPSKLGGLIYNLEMNLQRMLWSFMGISGSPLSHCHWAHPFFLSLPLCRLLNGHGYVTVRGPHRVSVRETFSVLKQDKLSNQVIIYFSQGNMLFFKN